MCVCHVSQLTCMLAVMLLSSTVMADWICWMAGLRNPALTTHGQLASPVCAAVYMPWSSRSLKMYVALGLLLPILTPTGHTYL
jgi:hypothetical protein